MQHPPRHDIIDALKLELAFIEKAERVGIGPAGLLEQGSLFHHSPVCANLRNSAPIHPCSHCPLQAFVPAHRRFERVPCHHIPLNASGETIATIDFYNQQHKLYRVVKSWLQSVIAWLDEDRLRNRGIAALLLQRDHGSLEGLSILLESLGIQTLHANTCREALNMLGGSRQPQLLFTEPTLADGAWSDVLDVLHDEGCTASALVVVSSHVDKSLAIEVIERGAFDCLISPVGVLDLAHVVRCAVCSPSPLRRTAVRAGAAGGIGCSFASKSEQ